MPNENTQKCKVFTAQTSKLENGEVAVEEIILENVPIPLFVLFAYGGGGAEEFLRAAEFKKQRLEFKYPDAEVRIIKGFEHPPQFKAEWTKLYNELTNSETACKYALWQVHYFGHGNEEHLIFRNEATICFDKNDNMERLPWHPNEGIFVLHSCRGAAYEDTLNNEKIKNQICLAKTISEEQKTRCLGQVTYASFTRIELPSYCGSDVYYDVHDDGVITETSKKEVYDSINEQIKYKSNPVKNWIDDFKHKPSVLWGYASLGLWVGGRIVKLKDDYENYVKENKLDLPRSYPIYEEIQKIGNKNQILPCRVFNKGKLEDRIVEVDVFNQNDLEYN
ncbi:hypothetical protein [uncultured Gilliamella sp.]|uniref:hypothetical protein n=1 Tax=uncultured Gilliamella sp. TaxID=1193505 RepID=UPI0025F85499|nr:hypothetical protein [uncultured Gilliamella sp.]